MSDTTTDQDQDQAEDSAVAEATEMLHHHINPEVLQNISVTLSIEVGQIGRAHV